MVLKRRSLEEALEMPAGENGVETKAEGWQDCLVKALVEMPPELSEKVLSALPKDVLMSALQSRDDPYLKLALLLLARR